jgi:hypothetical protein
MQYQGNCTKSNDTWIECKFGIQQCGFGCCNPNGLCITLPEEEKQQTQATNSNYTAALHAEVCRWSDDINLHPLTNEMIVPLLERIKVLNATYDLTV